MHCLVCFHIICRKEMLGKNSQLYKNRNFYPKCRIEKNSVFLRNSLKNSKLGSYCQVIVQPTVVIFNYWLFLSWFHLSLILLMISTRSRTKTIASRTFLINFKIVIFHTSAYYLSEILLFFLTLDCETWC